MSGDDAGYFGEDKFEAGGEETQSDVNSQEEWIVGCVEQADVGLSPGASERTRGDNAIK